MNRDAYVAQHFPEVDPGVKPCGAKILVQLRTIKAKTTGGILLVEETKDFNNGNTQLGRVASVGGIAFRDRSTGEEWKEGAWASVGDLVILPKWGGFRFEVEIPGQEEKAIFAVFDDTNVQMVVTGNPEKFDTIL